MSPVFLSRFFVLSPVFCVVPGFLCPRFFVPSDADAASYGIHLVVVGLPEVKKGFVLLPRRCVVERSNAWMARFRRLARDYERLDETLEGLHYVTFSILMLQ